MLVIFLIAGLILWIVNGGGGDDGETSIRGARAANRHPGGVGRSRGGERRADLLGRRVSGTVLELSEAGGEAEGVGATRAYVRLGVDIPTGPTVDA